MTLKYLCINSGGSFMSWRSDLSAVSTSIFISTSSSAGCPSSRFLLTGTVGFVDSGVSMASVIAAGEGTPFEGTGGDGCAILTEDAPAALGDTRSKSIREGCGGSVGALGGMHHLSGGMSGGLDLVGGGFVATRALEVGRCCWVLVELQKLCCQGSWS